MSKNSLVSFITKSQKTFKQILAGLALAVVSLGLSISLVGNAAAVQNVGKPDICTGNNNCQAGGFLDISQITSAKDIAGLAASIANLLTFVILSVAIVFIVYGAFIWLTDSEKGADRGRKIIFNAVIAMVIAVLAYGLTQAVINILYQQ